MNIKKKIVIFGVTGDLSKRMLLPSLDKLMREKLIDDVEIIGISRRIFNPNDIINNSAIIDKSNTPIKLINYTIETNNNDEYIKFKNFLNIDKETEVLIYLSVPPTSSLEYVEMLGKNNLNSNNIKLLIEKPFG
jgi:glucose-6-phosphate 1-dehydrogenase